MVLLILPRLLAAADLGTVSGTQWAPFLQWTLKHPDCRTNPFDVAAAVEFTHRESGMKRRTEMFYTGENTWAFRFTGTRTGLWTFVTSSEDSVLQGHRGKVIIHPNPRPDAHGFVKKFGTKWGWEGTEVAFVPQLVQWDYITGSGDPKLFYKEPKLIDRKIDTFIAGHGFNGFHVPVIAGRWFDLDAGTDRVTSSLTDPDPRTFEALELLITKTHLAGGLVHIWPWGDHQRSQTARSLKGGIAGAVDKRLQRYLAARLGPLPGWSMGYGFDLDEWVTADQVRTWRDEMQRLMGWHHFLGGRPAGPNRGTDHTADAQWNRGLDYSSYEHHRPTYEVYLAAIQASADQPVMSEDRFRVRPPKYPEKDYSPELTRRGLYHATLAGGVANIWGIHPDLSPGGVYPNREQIKTYAIFFHERGRFLADMVPANHLSLDQETRVLLSRSARSLVLYREGSDRMELDLRDLPGIRQAVAIDTKNAYREIPLDPLSPAMQTIALPSVSDWVVAVGDFKPL
jgi:hypothetical protein